MGLTTAAFTLFALPVGNGIGTQILVKVFHASPKLAAIRTVDEAIVIGAALSLSSSAFVLQIMAEKGELATKFGSATLGILLLQVQKPKILYNSQISVFYELASCTALQSMEEWRCWKGLLHFLILLVTIPNVT